MQVMVLTEQAHSENPPEQPHLPYHTLLYLTLTITLPTYSLSRIDFSGSLVHAHDVERVRCIAL